MKGHRRPYRSPRGSHRRVELRQGAAQGGVLGPGHGHDQSGRGGHGEPFCRREPTRPCELGRQEGTDRRFRHLDLHQGVRRVRWHAATCRQLELADELVLLHGEATRHVSDRRLPHGPTIRRRPEGVAGVDWSPSRVRAGRLTVHVAVERREGYGTISRPGGRGSPSVRDPGEPHELGAELRWIENLGVIEQAEDPVAELGNPATRNERTTEPSSARLSTRSDPTSSATLGPSMGSTLIRVTTWSSPSARHGSSGSDALMSMPSGRTALPGPSRCTASSIRSTRNVRTASRPRSHATRYQCPKRNQSPAGATRRGCCGRRTTRPCGCAQPRRDRSAHAVSPAWRWGAPHPGRWHQASRVHLDH